MGMSILERLKQGAIDKHSGERIHLQVATYREVGVLIQRDV